MKVADINKFIDYAIANSHGQYWEGIEVVLILKEIKIRLSNKDPAPENYKAFIAVYNEFYEGLNSVKPKFSAAYGASLKRIAKYLKEIAKSKDDEGALQTWQYLLSNWKLLSPFLKQQTSILQIEKNLNEIITQIRNGHHDKRSKLDNEREAVKQLDTSLADYIRRRTGGN